MILPQVQTYKMYEFDEAQQVERVGGSIPSSSCPHVKVSLDKTLNFKLLLTVRPEPQMIAR